MKLLYLILFSLFSTAPIVGKINTVIIAWSSLARPNEKTIERDIRHRIGLWHGIKMLFTRSIPDKKQVKRNLFSLLKKVPTTSLTSAQKRNLSYPSWETDHEFPLIYKQFLTSKSYEEEKKIYHAVSAFIQNKKRSKLNTAQRRIMQGTVDYIFRSAYMNTVVTILPQMLTLIKNLKKKGYNVILIGNVPGYAWETYSKLSKSQIIFKLFKQEHIFISGLLSMLQNSPEFYNTIISKLNLTADNCIVIESNAKNLKYPLSIGIKGITYSPSKISFQEFQKKLFKILD